MVVEPLPKGFAEIALHFGFAEAPDVPTALRAHRAEFDIDVDETSFFLGRESPVPTCGRTCQSGASGSTPS